MSPPRSTTTGVLLALGSALAFSSLAIWGKLAHKLGLPTFTVLPWRFVLVAAVLFAFGAGRGGFSRRDRGVMVLNGALYTLTTIFYFLALARISAGATALLLYLAPAFLVVYLWLLGRRPHGTQLLALALSAGGLGLVLGLPGAEDRDLVGLGLGMLTGAVYGGYLLFSERYLHYPPFTATAYLSLTSAGGFALAGLATGTLGVPDTLPEWGVTLGMAVFPTLLSVPLLFAAIRVIGATRTSLVATTEPVWTVLLAFVVLGEPLGRGTVLGGVLILGGALLAQWVPSGERPVAPSLAPTPPAGRG